MERNELISFTNDVSRVKSVEDLYFLEKKYSNFSNPYKDYLIGFSYMNNDDDFNSFKCFVNAAEKGIREPKKYIGSIYSDSIGSSISHILTKFQSEKLDSDIRYNLLVNSYFFLSSSINDLGITAYESYKNRAELLNKYEDDLTFALIINYLGIGSIPKVLIMSDYFFASQGYIKHGISDLSQLCLKKSVNLYNWLEDISINGKAADSYSIEEISNIGKNRHEIIYKKLSKDFLDNKFVFDLDLVRGLY